MIEIVTKTFIVKIKSFLVINLEILLLLLLLLIVLLLLLIFIIFLVIYYWIRLLYNVVFVVIVSIP